MLHLRFSVDLLDDDMYGFNLRAKNHLGVVLHLLFYQ